MSTVYSFHESLYLVDSNNGDFHLVRSTADAKVSANASTSTGALATDAGAGVKYTKVWRFCVPIASVLSADIVLRLRWEITAVAGGGAATGRVNLLMQRNQGQLEGPPKATGPTRAINAPAVWTELLHVRLPPSKFNPGDYLDFAVEVELVGLSGAGGSTSTIALHHNPAAAGNEAIVEVMV